MRAAAIAPFLVLLAFPSVAQMEFREISADWGVDFRHHHGGTGERHMVESVVGGVVVFDYDGDGDADLFFVDGGATPGYEGEPARSRLLRNDGGRFVDQTEASGIVVDGYGAGGTAGDVDRDGDLDLYVTAYGANQLWVNQGDGTFRDGTQEAGVGDPDWSMSATFFDADRDGDLDLYVTNYLEVTWEGNRFCGDRERGLRTYCTPDSFPPAGDRFYRNRGDGTFEDATGQAGLAVEAGAGLGVVAADLDGDGWPDLYVANDLTPNQLFVNQGDGTFRDQTLLSGAAYSDQGRSEAGMGVDLGDYDGDGDPDLVVTNFEFQTNVLYSNLGSSLFLDARYISGIAEPSQRLLGFGVLFSDFDLDGDLDLLVANGHLSDNIGQLVRGSRFAQPHQLFENLGTGRFRVVDGAAGLSVERATRALAGGDFDRDGDLDLVAVNSNDLAELYENLNRPEPSWLQVELTGGGFGAKLLARSEEPEAKEQLRFLMAGRSYLAQNEAIAQYGFGALAPGSRLALTVDRPTGERIRLLNLVPNRRVRLTP